MNKVELQKMAAGYGVATAGNLASFEGKAFVKEVLGTTSMEVSFGSLAAGEAVPFFHHHKQNEEVYIVLSGKGVFTLDKDEVEVTEGSIVRIEPQVSRCIKCTGGEPLVFMCIQAKADSLEQYVMTDAVIEQ